MHTKTVSSSDWDFGDRLIVPVQLSSRGLRGNDFKEFCKRASYRFADAVRRFPWKPGDVPAHAIALGAYEYFGFNKNADGFQEEDPCRLRHDTFVKFAKCYRDHRNTDPKKSYGYIADSSYNEDLKRVELLPVYNGTKEAADRNGGLVADEEISDLLSGRDFPGSMACVLPYDYCSSCGNGARNRGEYCLGVDEGGSCPGGGMRRKAGSWTGEAKHPVLGVFNPGCKWFDWSRVGSGADRTANTLSALVHKLASDGGVPLPQLADIAPPCSIMLSGDAQPIAAAIDRLAAAEKRGNYAQWISAFVTQPIVSWQRDNQTSAFAAMLREKVAMPLHGFVEFCGMRNVTPAMLDAAASQLPGIYGRLAQAEGLEKVAAGFSGLLRSRDTLKVDRLWAAKLASEFSIAPQHAIDRSRHAMFAMITPKPKKLIPVSKIATAIASHYALYKAAVASQCLDSTVSRDVCEDLLVAQDYALSRFDFQRIPAHDGIMK